MKHCFKIWTKARLGLASLVRIQLALSVLLLFANAGVPHTVATTPQKAVRIEKAIEALHVDFSSKVQVPAAPERFTQVFYLLPSHFGFSALLSSISSQFTRFLGVVATNTFYVFTRINAP
jgi:hypothetical protein